MAASVVIGVVGIGLQIGAYLLSQSNKQKTKVPTVESLGDVNFPTVDEGVPVPLVWGRVRYGPTFMWYGGYTCMPYKTKASGKGSKNIGGGSGRQIAGYYYLVCCWCGLGYSPPDLLGTIQPITIENVWRDGTAHGNSVLLSNYDTDCGQWVNAYGACGTSVNTGVNNTLPTSCGSSPLPRPLKLEGIASFNVINYISKDSWRMPSYEVAINRYTGTLGFHCPQGSYTGFGSNPAGIIAELLHMMGVPRSYLDEGSFQTAAWYFANWADAYGSDRPKFFCNKIITTQVSLGDFIIDLLQYMWVHLTIDRSGRFALVVDQEETQKVSGTIIDDFSEFQMKPRDLYEMPTEVRGKYTVSGEFDEEVYSFYAEHMRAIRGGPNPTSIDLTKILDPAAAEWLTTYYGYRMSQPMWTLTCTTSLRALAARPGDVWRIVNNVEGVSGTFRITAVTIQPLDKNEVNLECESTGAVFYDPNVVVMTGTDPEGDWTSTTYTPGTSLQLLDFNCIPLTGGFWTYFSEYTGGETKVGIYPYNNGCGATSIRIRAIRAASSRAPASLYQCQNMPLTAAYVDWNLTLNDKWQHNIITYTPDLTIILNELKRMTGWSPGNSVCFVFTNISGYDDPTQRSDYVYQPFDNYYWARPIYAGYNNSHAELV